VTDMGVSIGSLHLRNPIMPASGTFAEGLVEVVDIERLGAVVIKTITAELRAGNPVPRVTEVRSGMLNSIGIPSKGVPYFLDHTLPFYRRFQVPLVVSISAPTVAGFADIARAVSVPGVAAIEANISCPNLEEDGHAFAMQPRSTAAATAALRAATPLPLWVKLTPNVGDIAAVGRAAENAGADALVVANTILAMAIDVETRRPKLGSIMGGLSGPVIKPIVLRMTYQCARSVKIPVIGCGGISSAADAIEYMLAGATAVQVGTATFLQPRAMLTILDELDAWCARKGVARVGDLVGAVRDTDLELAPSEY
jgi:dihydroorotate dehydrogenase (NAD+) catalytic subunit